MPKAGRQYLTERKNMATEKKSEGKVIERLVKEYKAIVAGNESAIRAFIKSAHKAPSRDLEATLKEAQKSGTISAIRPAYANYFDLANTCLSIKGADSVSVYDFMKEVAVAQRVLRKEGALELVARISTWSDFVEKARKAEEVKKAKSTRTSKKANEAHKEASEAHKEAMKARATINGVIEFTLGALADLEGDALIIAPTHFEMAEALMKGLKTTLASSKALASKHPVTANA